MSTVAEKSPDSVGLQSPLVEKETQAQCLHVPSLESATSQAPVSDNPPPSLGETEEPSISGGAIAGLFLFLGTFGLLVAAILIELVTKLWR